MKLPALKPNKYGRISRATLLKYAKAGALQAACKYRMTDDYHYDSASNFGRTGWLPVRIREDREFKEGFINLDAEDFSSRYKTGGAWINSDSGTICFSIHSNLAYEMRVVMQ